MNSRLRITFISLSIVSLYVAMTTVMRLQEKRFDSSMLDTWINNSLRKTSNVTSTVASEMRKYHNNHANVDGELIIRPRYKDTDFDDNIAPDLERFKTACETDAKITKFIVRHKQTQLCQCIPHTLAGRFNGSFYIQSSSSVEMHNSGVRLGGEWDPQWDSISNCTAREKIAILIPLMNREMHLKILLSVLHPFLQRQQSSYKIYVAEQIEPDVFNKGAIINAAFTEITRLSTYDCVIFHDVDMLPEDDRNFYRCSMGSPLHAGSGIDKYNYTAIGGVTVGGVIGFTADHFRQVNGYSNQYYGWGGEDDDMLYRISKEKLNVRRNDQLVARYTMVRHERDKSNPINPKRHELLGKIKNMGKDVYKYDGLNSVKYEIRSLTQETLLTRIQLRVA